MDFLTFLQQQATEGNRFGPNTGPGTPGFAAAKLGGLTRGVAPSSTPTNIPSGTPADTEGGGFWDALNPFSSESDWGNVGLDWLSKPSYAMNNILQERARDISAASENGFQLSDIWAQLNPQVGQAWQGLSGEQKTLGADVVSTVAEETGHDPEKMNPWVKGGLGLGIDIFADPTTYIGGGLVKDAFRAIKGGKEIVEDAAKVADEAYLEIPAEAMARRFDPVEKKIGEVHPEQLQFADEGLFDVLPTGRVGVGENKALTAAMKKEAETPRPLQAPKATVADDQMDMFAGPTALKQADESPAPKIVEETVPVRTPELPFTAATITDKTKGMLQKVSDFSQMPVPTGQPLTKLEGDWVQPGSTNAYMRAGSHAVNNAEELIEKAEHFQAATKNKSPAQLTDLYKQGVIRPPADTPAEAAFINSISTSDLRAPAKSAMAKLDFHAIPDANRAGLISEANKLTEATVFTAGGAPRTWRAKQLWDVLHGAAPKKGVDLNNYFIRDPSGRMKSIAGIVEKNKATLDNPAYWAAARKNAAYARKNPEKVAERIMNQNIDHIRKSEEMVYDDFKDWARASREIYPDLSDEALTAAHDSVKHMLDEIWQRAVVQNKRGNVQKFMNAQHASTQLREVMAGAIARHSPPEELVTDAAVVEHAYKTDELKTDLAKVLDSSAADEVKEAIATEIDEASKTLNAELKATEDAAKKAPEVRAAEAQQHTPTVTATKARQAANYNEVTPGAQNVIDSKSWSSALTKDQAIGIVRGSVAKLTSTMSKSKNVKQYHQYNQAGMLNDIFAQIGKTSETLRGVLKHRGHAKSYESGKVVKLSKHISDLMLATEHQIDQAAGYMPNVYNGATKNSPGWAQGTPGKVQTEKIASPATKPNIPFSSAQLMEDMIRHDADLFTNGNPIEHILPSALFGPPVKGGKSALWTKVVEAALFKNKDALAAIPGKKLQQFLLNYDPAPNVLFASQRYEGKVTAYVKAQSSAAEKHIADAHIYDSAAREAKVVDESGPLAKEVIQRDPAAPVEDAAAIGDAAKIQGTDLADAMKPVNPVGNKMVQYKLPLGEVARVHPNMPKANNATRIITRAAGSEHIPNKMNHFEELGDVAFNKPWTLKWAQVFLTHAGAKVVRPIMQNGWGQVKASIAEAAREWHRYDRDILKAVGGDPDKALQSIKSLDASSGYEIAAGAEDLVRGMRKRMEDLLGGTDLTRFVAGNTAVTKGAVPRDQINKWLRSFGDEFQFDDSANWMNQWEKSIAKAKTPQEAINKLHTIENAIKNATAERFVFDDVVSRFASRTGGYTIDHPYLTGVGFESKEMAMEVKRMIELVEELQKPLASNAILRAYDQALRIWKTGMTIYNPAHHIKNFTGDYWLLMADGGGIRDFTQACKMLNKYKGKTFDTEAGIKISKKMEGIHDPAKLLEIISGPSKGTVRVKVKSSGKTYDDEQLMAAARLHGIFQSAGQLEDITEAGYKSLFGTKVSGVLKAENRLGQSLSKPAGGHIHQGASIVAETRDHSVRLAHFLHGVKNSSVKRTKGMTDAQYNKLVFEEAARRARTHHPDGLDLTKAERQVFRRMIPFYSWQRKSIPIILQTAWKRPGLVTAYPKMQTAMTVGSTGETPDNGFGSLPGDQMFPSWISENPWAVIGGAAAAGVAQGEAGGGYQLAKGPSVPSNDFLPMLNNPITNLGQVTPALRLPADLLYGKQIATGIPIEGNADRAELIGQQIPGVSKIVGAATNKQNLGTDLRNWGLGGGELGSGQYIDSAMWEQIERLKKIREAAKNE